ncbi:MAG: hypothetical protein ACYC8V_08980 [Caulobacteraceae bacterium]
MAMTEQTLTLDQLRAVARAGGVAEVALTADGGVFLVAVTTGAGERRLLVKTRTKAPRAFADPAKAAALLHGLGIYSARLDTGAWTPGRVPRGKSRPDRAAAMRRRAEAMEHDAWFRAEVARGLGEAGDPTTAWLSQDEVKVQSRRRRAAWRAAARKG